MGEAGTSEKKSHNRLISVVLRRTTVVCVLTIVVETREVDSVEVEEEVVELPFKEVTSTNSCSHARSPANTRTPVISRSILGIGYAGSTVLCPLC